MGKAGFLLILTTLLACTSASDVRVSMASVILEEGQTGKIFCVVKGIGSYYWRKGDFIDNSTKVASIVSGVPSAEDGSYSVNENGTLFIRRVVLEDEGKYFCRVASDETDCSGEVMIYVQASLPNFVIGIDRCYTKNSCLVLVDSSQSTSLTCIAKDVSYSMILKWYDGSTEITDNIRKNYSIVQGVREISSTLDVAHGNTGSLTCQAVEPKGRNDNGRYAHVQLEMLEVPVMTEVPVMPCDNRLGSVPIALITSEGCIIFLLVVLLLVKDRRTRRNRKSKERKHPSGEHEISTRMQGEELESLVETKEEEKMKQDKEITKLKEELHKRDGEIAVMKTTQENKEEQIKNEDEEISISKTTEASKEEQIMEQVKEISRLKEELQNRDREIALMKAEFESKVFEGAEPEELKRKTPKKPKLSVEEPQQEDGAMDFVSEDQ